MRCLCVRYLSVRYAAAVFLSSLLAGCGATRSETILIKPDTSWETVENKQTVSLSQRRDAASDEESRNVPLGNEGRLTMAGTIAIRQALASLAAGQGLAERTPTQRELASGFTEAFANDGGTALLIGENPSNRYLAVRVTGPANAVTRTLRDTVRARFAPPPPPESKEDPTEAFRKAYNLPGRQKPKK